jgi:hypothetical protein
VCHVETRAHGTILSASERRRPCCKSAGMSATRKTRIETGAKKWSRKVNETSDAMDLEPGVFKRSPAAIAASLKRSAEQSQRRRASPYQSAMSMLNFYINRGGRNLSGRDKSRLEQAKPKLRQLFHREGK